jgi:ABC-type transport system involved in cytochrome bd biosynthesis fused ATPase/permease subunit
VKRLVIAGVAGTLSAGSAIGLLAMSGWLISRSALRPPVLYLMVPVAAVQAFGLGRAVFRYAERLAGHDAALRLLAGLRMSAYGRLERLAPAGLAAFRSGDLMRRLVGDIDSLTDRWLRVRLPYAVAACTGAGAVALETALLPPAGAVLAGSLIGAAIAAPLLAGFVAGRAERRLAPLRGELAAATVDVIRGAGELAVFGGADAALDWPGPPAAALDWPGPPAAALDWPGPPAAALDWPGPPAAALCAVRDANDQVARCEARSAYARGIGAAICVLAAGAAAWASLAFGVQALRDGRLAGVLLAVVALLPLAVHEVFGGLAPAAQEIPRVRSAAARVREVMACPHPVREPDQPVTLPEGPYRIGVRGLIARWQAAGPDVLRGVDLDLPAGSRTAVIGPSGAGKTTLAMVLLRFLDPVAGTVTLNNTDITALDGDQVRSVIGLCAQDAHIFDSTLRENLRLARPDASDAELLVALGQARLADWVAGLPDGLDTPVGEQGARLSGGQRQRLALARVLLAGFPVVVFDEPAEHLDGQTAESLTRDLLAATPGRTVVLITHRRIEGMAIDQVIRLHDGQATVNPSLGISAEQRGTVPP